MIRQTHKENFYAYGYRKMWKTLRRAGETAPRCQVQRLMRCARDLWREAAREAVAHHDQRPERRRSALIWSTVTSPRWRLTVFGWAISRICAAGREAVLRVRDRRVQSRRIVGWQLASHMRTDLVLDALRMALGTRQPGADFTLVTHTDQGSQYAQTTTRR